MPFYIAKKQLTNANRWGEESFHQKKWVAHSWTLFIFRQKIAWILMEKNRSIPSDFP